MHIVSRNQEVLNGSVVQKMVLWLRRKKIKRFVYKYNFTLFEA